MVGRQQIGRYLFGRWVSALLGNRVVSPSLSQGGASSSPVRILLNAARYMGWSAVRFLSQKFVIWSGPGLLKFFILRISLWNSTSVIIRSSILGTFPICSWTSGIQFAASLWSWLFSYIPRQKADNCSSGGGVLTSIFSSFRVWKNFFGSLSNCLFWLFESIFSSLFLIIFLIFFLLVFNNNRHSIYLLPSNSEFFPNINGPLCGA